MMTQLMQLTRPDTQTSPSERWLRQLFEQLDDAGIPYCLLHGYESLGHLESGDVDCLLPASVLPARLATLLGECGSRAGATQDANVVQWLQDEAHFVVLALNASDVETTYLQLHAHRTYSLCKRFLYSSAEILASRRRFRNFWIPAARIEFTCRLARRIAKGRGLEEDARRLNELYADDPSGCREELARWLKPDSVQRILAAAEMGDWSRLGPPWGGLRRELLWRSTCRHPLRFAGQLLGAGGRRMGRWLKPNRGLNVVFLGTDGSGKTSVSQEIRQRMAPVFTGAIRRSFPPALLNRGGSDTSTNPHAEEPRSVAQSIVRAIGYWFTFSLLDNFAALRPALSHNRLVLHDRHLVDALVDSRRYRYGGPESLLRLIVRLIPKPDLVILLDAPAEVTQSRKQEVPLTEARRQREAYRSLVEEMPHGHIVDSTRPLPTVVKEVEQILLDHLAARVARQLYPEVKS